MGPRFQIGDRVILIKSYNHLKEGDRGIVLEYSGIPRVRWDKPHPNNHSCSGLCKDKYGWSVMDECIELVNLDTNYEIY